MITRLTEQQKPTDILTVDDVIRLCGLRPSDAARAKRDRLIAAGRMPAPNPRISHGRKPQWFRGEVDAWLRDALNITTSGSEQ